MEKKSKKHASRNEAGMERASGKGKDGHNNRHASRFDHCLGVTTAYPGDKPKMGEGIHGSRPENKRELG